MSNTLEEILESAYFKMGEKTTSTVFERTGNMLQEANRIQRAICQGRYENIITWETYEAWNLIFMQDKKHYQIVPSVGLGADCAAAATSLTVDTTNYATSGKILIDDDIIAYTGTTATSMTGVSWVDIRHFANDRVRQLYALPDNFYKVIDLYYNDEPMEYHEWNDTPLFADTFYEIIEDSQSGYSWMNSAYLNVVGLEGSTDNVLLRYLRDTSNMEDDADYCELPGDFGVKVISNLLAGQMLYDTEEPEKGIKYLTAGYAALKKLYKDYAERRRPFRKKVRTSTFTYLS